MNEKVFKKIKYTKRVLEKILNIFNWVAIILILFFHDVFIKNYILVL